jgi:hypothetical protein
VAFTYDLNTDTGKVRLLIPDTQADAYVLEDEEIAAFMGMESGLKRAAALAMETIARNELLVLKVIQILDLRTDGAAVARELRQQAAVLREQAAADDELAAGDGWDIAGMIVDDFTLRQAVYGDALWGLY